jgi:hypothetical protein
VARLADAGDVTAMMAENQPLEQIADRFAERCEAHGGFPARGYLREGAQQAQRLGQKIAQMDLDDTLLADHLRERFGRVKADRGAFGALMERFYDSMDVVPFGDWLAAAPLSSLWDGTPRPKTGGQNENGRRKKG